MTIYYFVEWMEERNYSANCETFDNEKDTIENICKMIGIDDTFKKLDDLVEHFNTIDYSDYKYYPHLTTFENGKFCSYFH